ETWRCIYAGHLEGVSDGVMGSRRSRQADARRDGAEMPVAETRADDGSSSCPEILAPRVAPGPSRAPPRPPCRDPDPPPAPPPPNHVPPRPPAVANAPPPRPRPRRKPRRQHHRKHSTRHPASSAPPATRTSPLPAAAAAVVQRDAHSPWSTTSPPQPPTPP